MTPRDPGSVPLPSRTRFVRRLVGCLLIREVRARLLHSDGDFTWFNARGAMAPIGGFSFFPRGERGELSCITHVGHVIYGVAAIWWFERGRRRSAADGPAMTPGPMTPRLG